MIGSGVHDSLFDDALRAIAQRGSRRALEVADPVEPGWVLRRGGRLLNVSGNDYLGLSRHPALIARSAEWTARHGAGAGASRLVSGTLDLHRSLESRIARFKGSQSALLFASGWQANASVLPALLRAFSRAGPPLLFTDRLNHASLHHGAQAASVRQIRFRHNDLGHLQSLLEARATEPGARMILTESVFSMDGDRADLAGLADIARRHRAFLAIDEAHATGVLGPKGRGLAAGNCGADCVIGTFSKAMGSFGAYVAGSALLCDYLINTCSGFIHTTALPPPVLGAIDAALDLAPTMDAERAHLAAQSQRLRAALHRLGIDTAHSSTQIVPAILGGAGRALAASRAFAERGVLAVAIRPPTVPNGASRIRFALSSVHDAGAVDHLIGLLPECLAPE